MELIDRYLQAIKFWLPNGQKQDIAAELSEEIRSQMDQKETELGRELHESEVEALLKRVGSPVLVAQRFLPQRHLVGPVLFPIYRLVLKSAFSYYLVLWFLIWILRRFFDPSHRTLDAGAIVTGTLGTIWTTGVYVFAVVTAVFAVVEKFHSHSRILENWNPRELPAMRDANQISRCSSGSEIAWFVMLALWWVGWLRFPAISGLHFALGPLPAGTLYWPILVFLLAAASMAFVNLVRPWWTPRRAGIRLAINAFGLLLVVGLLLSSGPLVDVSSANASPASLESLTRWIYLTVVVTLVTNGISFALRGLQDTRRLLGKRPFNNWVMTALAGT